MAVSKYLGIFGIVAIVMFTSCEKELNFEYHDIAPLHVIEANVGNSVAEVRISLTTPMDEAVADTPVTQACATLSDLDGGAEYVLTPDADGVFRAAVDGMPGHQYRLNVRVAGATYSSCTTMATATEIVDAGFYWVKMPGDDMAALRIIIADDPAAQDYYWIRVYRNGRAYMWDVIDDQGAADGMLDEVLTTTHRDESKETENQLLRDGDEVAMRVCRVNREMFDYLVAVKDGQNGAAMYAGGPCLGYFLASPVAERTLIYRPDEIEYAK